MKFNNQKIFVWVVTISVLGCIVPEPPSALAVHESGVESEQSHGFVQQGSLEPADGLAHDRVGHAVAISGDTVNVGAPRDDVGANTDQGSAYIFVRSGTTWIQQAKLTPDDGEAFELFGGSVAISGNTVIVGAESDDVGSNPNQGSAYVFARSGTTWLQQAKLTALDGSADDRFGVSVAISGLTAIVGSYEDDVGTVSDQGSAYVYVRSIATPIWSQQAKLTFLDGEANDNFGASVGISGSTAVVGVPVDTIGANLAQGSACVFVRSGTTWSQQGRLVANDGAAGDAFGLSLGISGDTVIAGAVLSD